MADDDMAVEGRVHDGFQFYIELENGRSKQLNDHDDLASVTARLDAAIEEEERSRSKRLQATQAALAGGQAPVEVYARSCPCRQRLWFSGARTAEEDEETGAVEIGLLDGKGWVYASDVASISYFGPAAYVQQDAAIAAARALFEAQAGALRAAQEESEGDEGGEPEGDGTAPPVDAAEKDRILGPIG